jgi:hypothetical protein
MEPSLHKQQDSQSYILLQLFFYYVDSYSTNKNRLLYCCITFEPSIDFIYILGIKSIVYKSHIIVLYLASKQGGR